MRKIINALMLVLLIFSFVGCAETSSIEKETQKAATLNIGETYTIKDYAEFKPFKISTTDTITGALGNWGYDAPSGKKYVDLILDYTNLSTENIYNDKLVSLKVKNEEEEEYTCSSYYIETLNGSDLSNYEEVTPLSSVRLHCATAIDPNESKVVFLLTVDGETFTCGYTVNETVSEAVPMLKGDVVKAEDFAEIEFKGVEYTSDLLPSNTSSYYNHYLVDNSDNTYLVIMFELKNLSSTARDIDNFIGVKASYLDKYTYTGFCVAEDEDGAGFSSYEDIAPLTKKKLFYIIEVPKEVIENQVTVEISFNGREYLVTYSK